MKTEVGKIGEKYAKKYLEKKFKPCKVVKIARNSEKLMKMDVNKVCKALTLLPQKKGLRYAKIINTLRTGIVLGKNHVIAEGFPDFIVVGRTFGIFFVEVKTTTQKKKMHLTPEQKIKAEEIIKLGCKYYICRIFLNSYMSLQQLPKLERFKKNPSSIYDSSMQKKLT